MNYSIYTVLGFTIGAPALIGLIRFKKIENCYVPFILLTWLGLASETVSYILLKNGHDNAIVYNVYSLAEIILIVWQFKRWDLFEKHRWLYPMLLAVFTGWWIAENFIIDTVYRVNSYFLIGSSACVVIMSIHLITELLFFEPHQLVKNSKFLICIGFILFFSFSILVEVFWMFGLHESRLFRIRIYDLLFYVNAVANIIFALSVLWIPTKFRFIQP